MNSHILKYIQPAISFTSTDYGHLTFVRTAAHVFPKCLHARRDLPLALINHKLEASPPEPLSFHELLVSAYFGYLPIPESIQKFRNLADQINRHRTSADADQLKRYAKQRDTEVAREFGVRSSDAMCQVYDTLDTLAQRHNFSSYKAIWEWNHHVQDSKDDLTDTERETFAAGPRYLFEFAQRARKLKHADIVFATLGEWVLYFYKGRDGVNAYPIHPASLRRSKVRDIVSAIAPDEILDALREQAQFHFPDVPKTAVCIAEIPVILPAKVLLAKKINEEC
jgi:hypothetical protein